MGGELLSLIAEIEEAAEKVTEWSKPSSVVTSEQWSFSDPKSTPVPKGE